MRPHFQLKSPATITLQIIPNNAKTVSLPSREQSAATHGKTEVVETMLFY